jgi:hypothetical protein
MRKRLAATLSVAILGVLAIGAVPSFADDEGFGLKNLDVTFTDADGTPAMGAGTHPFAWTTEFEANTMTGSEAPVPIDAVKDLRIELPPGLVGNPGAVPRCTGADFAAIHGPDDPSEELRGLPFCSDSSVIGVVSVTAGFGSPGDVTVPFYNLEPPPGVAAKFGFIVLGLPVTVEGGVNPEPPYNLFASLTNTPQPALFYGSTATVWGNPASPAHDAERGHCLDPAPNLCPAGVPNKPFLTMPRSCEGPLKTSFEVNSWQNPGVPLRYELESHDDSVPPKPLGTLDCAKLGFAPQISSKPTTDHAESPSGLDFNLDIDDEGLTSPDGLAQSDIKKAAVTLPEGVTVNPSVAEGLAACTPGQYAAESVGSEPGQGCPEASKVGTVEVETPLLEGEVLKGQVFVASQDDPATAEAGAENPFDSLIALYMVIRHPELGILVKLAGKVEPDPQTGQLVTTFGEPGHEIPQFPFAHFRFHFREGGRSPLITPSHCGTYTTKAVFTPWANPDNPLTTTASFQITRGVGGAPCPPGGVPPFKPGFSAGSLNNDAGSYSPFYLRLTRQDGEQDMTKFSSVLPPGVVGKIAGVGKCPDAQIEAAKAKTGRQELASPSCPASSQIGRTLGGAGAGSQLTYVPGKLYLAGPVGGDPLSVVAIVPAVAGPFDAGTVVVRVALTLNRETAVVEADGANSDPIPHILKGIPLKVRDLRVYVDRENFTLNPTSCEPSEVRATLFGSFLDVFSPADDVPVDLASRFQAANCANLGFKPKLSLKLKGGTKRGGHPGLLATYRPRPGDANVKGLVVRLPRSAFLDQAHIRTICTRVQFAADACPAGSIYGKVTAFTPLLEEPLTGPAYLRSSDNKLPDLVFDLKGVVEIEASARIDSIGGGIRATFAQVPDAPVSKVIVEMQGGKKGLIVNSRDLCAAPSRADARLGAHNGKRLKARPVVEARCGGKKRAKR